MSEYIIAPKEKIQNIANSIREKTNSNNTMSLSDIPINIMSMSGDGGSSVLYSAAQNLTTSQKLQARKNINAQETLSFDEVPMENSTNPVTSGGVYENIRDIQESLYNMTSTPLLWDGRIGDKDYVYISANEPLCLVKISEDISDFALYCAWATGLEITISISSHESLAEENMVITFCNTDTELEQVEDGVFGNALLYIVTRPITVSLDEENEDSTITLSRGIWALAYNFKYTGIDMSLFWLSAISSLSPIFTDNKTIENYFEKQTISLHTLSFEDIHKLPSYTSSFFGNSDLIQNWIKLGDPLPASVGEAAFMIKYTKVNVNGSLPEEQEAYGTIIVDDNQATYGSYMDIPLLVNVPYDIDSDDKPLEKGLYALEHYFIDHDNCNAIICNTCTIENYNFTVNCNVLKQKYLPNETILKSSTPNSTKQFKLTVDDNGIISAMEVQ